MRRERSGNEVRRPASTAVRSLRCRGLLLRHSPGDHCLLLVIFNCLFYLDRTWVPVTVIRKSCAWSLAGFKSFSLCYKVYYGLIIINLEQDLMFLVVVMHATPWVLLLVCPSREWLFEFSVKFWYRYLIGVYTKRNVED